MTEILAFDCRWEPHAGRERDGEKFAVQILIHASGRIPAKIICPATADEYYYRLFFYLETDMDKEEYQFIDLDSAQRFAESVLDQRAGKKTPPVPTEGATSPRSSAVRAFFRRLMK